VGGRKARGKSKKYLLLSLLIAIANDKYLCILGGKEGEEVGGVSEGGKRRQG